MLSSFRYTAFCFLIVSFFLSCFSFLSPFSCFFLSKLFSLFWASLSIGREELRRTWADQVLCLSGVFQPCLARLTLVLSNRKSCGVWSPLHSTSSGAHRQGSGAYCTPLPPLLSLSWEQYPMSLGLWLTTPLPVWLAPNQIGLSLKV